PTITVGDCFPHTITLSVVDASTPTQLSGFDTTTVTATGCPDPSDVGPSDEQGGGEQAYPQDGNGGNGDIDGDGIPDHFDNCPRTANQKQQDLDGDTLGDVRSCCFWLAVRGQLSKWSGMPSP